MIAIQNGFGVQRREIAAGIRFGKSLAPNLLASEHGPQISFLLGFSTQRDNSRSNQSFTDDAEALGRAGERQFLLKDCLLHRRGAPATILGRPRDAGPAAVE